MNKSKQLRQTLVSGIPPWYIKADEQVEKSILVQLLLRSTKLTKWLALPDVFSRMKDHQNAADAQQIVISYIENVFLVECI